MARLSRRKQLMSEINVVPYIDVMLVLLVIFMITTPLLTQGVVVDLPQATAEALEADQLEPIVVTVDVDGQYYLNISERPNESMAPDVLARRVMTELRRNQTRTVLVKGDRDVNYGKVVTAMVLLQQAGAERVGLITQQLDDI